MATRRQEKLARAVRDAVSDAIMNHLGDPRIEGFVSITRVEVAADLRNAEVYFSIFGKEEKVQDRTFEAINHARPKVQAIVADRITSKFCPVLRFHRDDNFKKVMETLNLIDKVATEFKKEDSDEEC